MENNNYLSLINFKVKLYHQELSFINEHNVGCLNLKKKKKNFKLNIQHCVHLSKKKKKKSLTMKFYFEIN